MTTTYCVNISMDQNTVEHLAGAGYSLFVFKAVRGSCPAVPLVWAKVNSYGLKTPINWNNDYQAYTSFSSTQTGQNVYVNNSYQVDCGYLFTINSLSGVGVVTSNGCSPTVIGIYNSTLREFTCGITQWVLGGAFPPSAFTLFGNMQNTVSPLETVLLMFSRAPFNVGDVMTFSDSQCVTIDLSAQAVRSITYAINQGWDTNNEVGLTTYPPNTPLTPLLIQPVVKS